MCSSKNTFDIVFASNISPVKTIISRNLVKLANFLILLVTKKNILDLRTFIHIFSEIRNFTKNIKMLSLIIYVKFQNYEVRNFTFL